MTSDSLHAHHNLPVPDADALARSAALEKRIRERVAAQGGQLTLGEYMHAALYEPQLGYYVSGNRKFGEAGDFVTAPELGNVFAQCCAHAFARVLTTLTTPTLVEIGAGTGQFACDVLLALEQLDALPARYQILEVSADLRARQQDLVRTLPAHLAAMVEWLTAPLQESFDGIVFGNEVIDALPVERFRDMGTEAVEMDVVTQSNNRLQLASAPASALISNAVRLLHQQADAWPVPYCSELRPGLGDWLQSVTGCLRHGAVLFVDYGSHAAELYHPQRQDGTLLCHYRHRAHDDLLLWPGLQDITAWVDFSALAAAATEQGFVVDGYTTQAHFLMDCELDTVVSAAFERAGQADQIRLSAQVRCLTLPGEMGERFKAIGFRRGTGAGLFSGGHKGFEQHLSL